MVHPYLLINVFFIFAGYDHGSQGNSNTNQSSLDCLSLIVDSIAPKAAQNIMNNMTVHDRPPL